MRLPIAPAGYIVASVQDLSWDEDRRTKAAAVTFRDPAGEPLFVIYRLEPQWVFEDAVEMGQARCLNLLRFYPWPEPGRPEDTSLQADAANATAVVRALRFDGQPVDSQRYVSHGVVVDMVFFVEASVGVARPASATLPDLQTEPYETFRPDIPPPSGEYFGYHEQGPAGDFRR